MNDGEQGGKHKRDREKAILHQKPRPPSTIMRTNHADVFAAIEQSIFRRQKQWNDHNNPFQKMECRG